MLLKVWAWIDQSYQWIQPKKGKNKASTIIAMKPSEHVALVPASFAAIFSAVSASVMGMLLDVVAANRGLLIPCEQSADPKCQDQHSWSGAS